MSEKLATLYIQVDIGIASRIGEAARAIAALAKRLNNPVQGEFNGRLMWAHPGDSPAEVLAVFKLLSKSSKGA